ncbi:MAG: NADH:ubiquinone oxidoreductase 24 kD subunit [Clostridia bacterium]|nr:NADH:ubiquinone oxidoreductase 24 kD subunit [Clostridia bacterium]
MNISICIGSSCHLKGSYIIIQRLQALLAENNIEDKINLNASFCLGHCTKGVTVKIDDEFVEGLSKDNIDDFFKEKIMNKL